jgi:glycosyltransferase involved in cell wall biosynthesis
MSPSSGTTEGTFVVATPLRSVCDDNARALEKHGLLRFLALATRRGSPGIPTERTRLNPAIGLAAYAAAKIFSSFNAESFRFRLHPWFDRWVRGQLKPGNHIISSYGYVNSSFRWVRQNGGKTFLDGGNSHPENFWSILSEEHRRWNCAYPPVSRRHYERSKAMMEHVDYVLSPSSFVSRSFLERGFKPGQILRNIYPLDLSCFKPPTEPRPENRGLTVIAPGSLSLRKGTPYLLEAFSLVLKKVPSARLVLNRAVANNVMPVVEKYSSLPIDWRPPLSHPQLAEAMRASDMLVLPSLEDGFARTVTEGLACGLPIITTPNTGASDLIIPGRNGEIVPIRDSAAIAEAILKWHDRIASSPGRIQIDFEPASLSFEKFENEFIDQLTTLGLAGSFPDEGL